MPSLKTIIAPMLWLAPICFGFHILLNYESRPGPASSLTQFWPRSSNLHLSSSPYTLVIFVHPQCPCSNATLTELAILMTNCKKLTTYVLFLRPKGFPAGWEETALWKRAAAMPGVKPIADIDGAESVKFAATTSGETALYDGTGKLLFEGGITATRGHEGDNQGLSEIEAIVGGAPPGVVQTAVFGCALKDDLSQLNEAKHSCLK